jgi:hypothetical protein
VIEKVHQVDLPSVVTVLEEPDAFGNSGGSSWVSNPSTKA